MSVIPALITFEQPLTERVRTFLRLEFLFLQRRHHAVDGTDWSVRAGVQALLDVLALTARSDLKTEVIKELIEQQTLLAKSPTLLYGLDAKTTRLELLEAQQAVQRTPTHFAGTALRSHDFLDAIAKRAAIPGGAASFDMPAVHRWLSEPAAKIEDDLVRWFNHFSPYETAIAACLRTLRHAGASLSLNATAGVHLYTPKGIHQMLRVTTERGSVYPEISAGRHRYSLRFMQQPNVDMRAEQIQTDFPFTLQCCAMLPSS